MRGDASLVTHGSRGSSLSVHNSLPGIIDCAVMVLLVDEGSRGQGRRCALKTDLAVSILILNILDRLVCFIARHIGPLRE